MLRGVVLYTVKQNESLRLDVRGKIMNDMIHFHGLP